MTTTCEHGRTEAHTYPNQYYGSCGVNSRCDGPSATVCVRLDGLADQIAAELERTMFASDRKIPEVIVDLLQSLAVQ